MSNTFHVEQDGVTFQTQTNPPSIYDNASVEFGGFVVDHNTFGCDNGVLFDVSGVCWECDHHSRASFGDFTITNNDFEGLDEDAVHIAFDGVGEALDRYATVELGDMVVASNIISGAQNGVYVGYGGIQAEYSATVSMGTLDITGNDIGNVISDGVYLSYTLSAADSSTVTVGRALVQLNNISFCGDDGVDLDDISIVSDTNALATVGDPVVQCNNIFSNSGYGVENDASGRLLDAENNWWGAASGPDDDAGVINGSGDRISLDVDADPWLTAPPADGDGDGFYPAPCGGDCDDSDPAVYPGATEGIADGIDQNCDGIELCYVDADNDGYRPDTTSTTSSADLDCTDPGEAEASDPTGDCDDDDPDVNPAAVEVCNGIDDDCDTLVDDDDGDCTGQPTWYADSDEDGYGDPAVSVQACAQPADHVADNTDCDDEEPAANPGAVEICDDEIDNDCDALVDREDPDCPSAAIGGAVRPAHPLRSPGLLAGLMLGTLVCGLALAWRQRLSQ
jgi:hypothetical protein